MIDLKHYYNKVVVFFNQDKATYWHTITRNTLEKKPMKIGRYYLNFESKLYYPERIDSEGIPLYKWSNGPYFYHPIVICQYALGIFEHLYQTNFKDENFKRIFFLQADWLINNSQQLDFGKVWYVGYDIPEYQLFKPWYSALSQGEAVSVLTRAFLISNDQKYLRMAEEAISPLNVLVKDGGLLNYFKSLPVYEEYPSPIKTVGALCGYMFVLFGLYDLILINKNPLALELFEKGIRSLKTLLPFYDLGYWSRYYIFDYPNNYSSSFTYHSLKFEQLKTLYIITGDKYFLDYSEKWESYTKNPLKKMRALMNKILFAKTLK